MTANKNSFLIKSENKFGITEYSSIFVQNLKTNKMKKFLLLGFTLLTLMMNGQIPNSLANVTSKNLKPITMMGDGIGTAYGDSKSAISTVYSDGKEVVKYLTPKTEKLLDKISTKLETTTKSLWVILVKQQRVWSWCYLIGFIISILSWVNFYRIFDKSNNDLEGDGEWKTQNTLLAVAVFLMSLGFTILSVIHVVPMMTGFLNPEFGALQTIAEIAKSIK